jgi:SnoaL-like domain
MSPLGTLTDRALSNSASALPEVDAANSPTETPAAINARLDRIGADTDALAAMIEADPRAAPAILAAATTRLGNATVQRAMAKVRAAGSTEHSPAIALRTATEFYAAFAQRSASVMTSHYAPNVSFHDPLFGHLRGAEQVMRMWTSIMPKANPFEITPSVASTATSRPDGTWEVHVTWDANYGLGSAHIRNHSETTLVIAGDKIIEQRDEWDLDRWTAQALPMHLGGHHVTDLLTAAAAHSYIEIIDLIERHRAKK